MSDLDTPYKSEPKMPEAAGHGHHHAHHLSHWALLIGFSVPILTIGLVTNPVILTVGILLVAFGVVGWFREDYLEFPKGPNPLTQHTQGEKDNGWWGIMLFLASEVIIFASIFSIWFGARAFSTETWPPVTTPIDHLPVVPTGINTIILVISGFVMQWGEKGIITGNRRRFVIGFGGAIVLGSIFLYGQVLEYQELIHEDFLLSTDVYTSTFYMLTGTHGLHVFGGLLFLLVVLVRGALGQFDAKRHTAVTAAAYYWHFVDIVWLFLYAVVYLEWL